MQRYRLVSDNDCHDYLIPAEKAGEWSAWRDLPEDDEAGWFAPDWAQRLRTSRLTFTDPRED